MRPTQKYPLWVLALIVATLFGIGMTGCGPMTVPGYGQTIASDAQTAIANTAASFPALAVSVNGDNILNLYAAQTGNLFALLDGKHKVFIPPQYGYLARAAARVQVLNKMQLSPAQQQAILELEAQCLVDFQGYTSGAAVPLTYVPVQQLIALKAHARPKALFRATAMPDWFAALWNKLTPAQQAELAGDAGDIVALGASMGTAAFNAWLAGDQYTYEFALCDTMTVDQIIGNWASDELAENAAVRQWSAQKTELDAITNSVFGAITAAFLCLLPIGL